MIIRDFTKKLEKRLLSHTPFIQVVLGPRQVGKTTALKQIIETWQSNSIYETADIPSPPDQNWIINNWNRARKKLSKPTLLVLDEIQKIPRWSEVIKMLFDEDRENKNLRVVLLGSASLSLGNGLTESLAGRFEINNCKHWDFEESKKAFNWDFNTFLKFGGYPAPAMLINEPGRWTDFMRMSIIEPVISVDILNSIQINNSALFRQTLELAMCHPAKELSYQKFLGQLQDKGNTTTIKNYLNILENAFFLKELRKYTPNILTSRLSSPKIIPLCPALINSFNSPNRIEEDLAWKGFMLEAYVGSKLLSQFLDVYYWRQGNHEVDFVVEVNKKPIAIEVKLKKARSKKGINEFLKQYKNAEYLIITEDNLEELKTIY